MAPYFIDGKEARGEDYAKAIEALPNDADDYPADVCIETLDKRTLLVSNWSGGFKVIDKRSDGSEWLSPTLNKDQVKGLVVAFLSGDEWRQGLQWELGELATRDAGRRMLLILLAGACLVGLALWWSGLFTK